MGLKTNLNGTEQMIRERLRTHHKAGINTLAVQLEGSREEKLNTLERLAAIVREESPED